jgi:predicted nucleic acid-binding protein
MNLSLTNTQADSIFLDANIALEIILERQNMQLAKDLLLKHSDNNLYVSSLTAHLIIYFGQKRVGLPILRQFLEDYTILQLAVAIRNGCSSFITFDKSLVDAYNSLNSIPIHLVA